MTLTQLTYMVALAHHRSFGLAARKCHITQPTLSMQIQKLEELLGVMIFDRSKQPVVPTATGHRLIEQAKIILREADRLKEIVDEESGLIQGDFRLGIIPTIAPYLLPLFLQEFVDLYPNVRLTVEELETAQIVQHLKDDSIDAGILATPLHDQGILENKLYDEPFFVYLPSSNDLAQKNEVREKDLPLERILLLNEGNCLRDQMISLCQFKAKAPKKQQQLHFESGSLTTLIRLVENGSGFTILPFLALDGLPHKNCVIRPFASPAPIREISLVVHRTYVKRNVLEALHKEIMKHLPKALKDFQKTKGRLIE
ncbi:MAG: LysR substrate-binding domain-containing protein, partial [Proteobacteria bacterium]|nr:LysR substrate-binding domain-containing protein [Pseudomonadota bacterium]